MGLKKWRLSAVHIFVISSILTCIPQGLGALGLEISALYPTWGSVVNFVKKVIITKKMQSFCFLEHSSHNP